VLNLCQNKVNITLKVLHFSPVIGILSEMLLWPPEALENLETVLADPLCHIIVLDLKVVFSDHFQGQRIVSVSVEALFKELDSSRLRIVAS